MKLHELEWKTVGIVISSVLGFIAGMRYGVWGIHGVLAGSLMAVLFSLIGADLFQAQRKADVRCRIAGSIAGGLFSLFVVVSDESSLVDYLIAVPVGGLIGSAFAMAYGYDVRQAPVAAVFGGVFGLILGLLMILPLVVESSTLNDLMENIIGAMALTLLGVLVGALLGTRVLRSHHRKRQGEKEEG
jgi:hypothetical protein